MSWAGCVQWLKVATKKLKSDVWALYYAMEHPETPLIAKLVALITVSYLFSPIDLIPDCIPVLGILDDLVLVPLGLWVAYKLIPVHVLEECKRRVAEEDEADNMEAASGGNGYKRRKPQTLGTKVAAACVVLLWTLLFWKLFNFVSGFWLPDVEATSEIGNS